MRPGVRLRGPMKRSEKTTDTSPIPPLALEDYEAIFRFSMDAVMLTIPDGRILAANPAACEMLRLSEDEIIRRGRRGITDPSDERWASSVAQRARNGHVRSELSFLRGDGTRFVADMSSNVFADADGEQRTCTVFRDVTDRVEQREDQARLVEELRGLSMVDELTGIRNRRGLMSGAAALLAVADRKHEHVQALFIDVDNLKELNDHHGHPAGDEALKAVAGALQRSVRATDLVARVGGDEFVALILGADVAVRRIRQSPDRRRAQACRHPRRRVHQREHRSGHPQAGVETDGGRPHRRGGQGDVREPRRAPPARGDVELGICSCIDHEPCRVLSPDLGDDLLDWLLRDEGLGIIVLTFDPAADRAAAVSPDRLAVMTMPRPLRRGSGTRLDNAGARAARGRRGS